MPVWHYRDPVHVGDDLLGVAAEAPVEPGNDPRDAGRRPAHEFRIGDLTATGLASGSVDTVGCIDAIQFADPPPAAYPELRRVLVPGARVALTCCEVAGQATPELPERLINVDLATGLTAVGFVDVDVRDRPEWLRSERSLWEEAPPPSTQAPTPPCARSMRKASESSAHGTVSAASSRPAKPPAET